MKLKFDSQMSRDATDALAPHIHAIYERQGGNFVFMAEARHVERIQPAPDADKEPSVKVRIVHLEIPNRDQVGAIREGLRALYLQRTASGTLEDDGQLVLSDRTLQHITGLLHEVEVARLRAGLRHWVNYAHRVNNNGQLTVSEMQHELDLITRGLEAVLTAAAEDES